MICPHHTEALILGNSRVIKVLNPFQSRETFDSVEPLVYNQSKKFHEFFYLSNFRSWRPAPNRRHWTYSGRWSFRRQKMHRCVSRNNSFICRYRKGWMLQVCNMVLIMKIQFGYDKGLMMNIESCFFLFFEYFEK